MTAPLLPRRGYHPHLLALEARMMFDAAAAVVAQDLASADTTGDHIAPSAPDTHAGEPAPGAAHVLPAPLTGFADDRSVPGAASVDDPLQRDVAYPADIRFTDQRTLADVGRDSIAVDAVPGAAHEIIFIDTAVADYRQLAAQWAGRGEVVLIDGTRDGIDQMRAALAGQSNIGAIHIVSHGVEGAFWLGTTRVDAASIQGDLAASLGAIGRSLGAGGDILVYGCDFAEGSAGADALAAFAQATHADVAASTDTTGFGPRGGDWVLEARRGVVDTGALSSADWVHTLDPNTPVPIAVTADSLTVTNGAGTVVVTGTTGYGGDSRSPDVGVGSVAVWANAATFRGNGVDLKATVVSLSTSDAIRFNRPTGTGLNGDDPTFLLRDLTSGATPASVQIRWELVDSATGQPLAANVRFTIADIDGIGGNPNTRETVTAATAGLAYFTRERVSDINFTSSLNTIAASGTQDENTIAGQPLSSKSAATFDWSTVSAWTLTYTLTNNAQTAQAQFYHDGDADFAYNDPIYVSVPRLDLDGNDSTAAGNDAHFTFTENGPGVPVVDTDLVVSNPMDINSITGATVTLTNYYSGDAFAVGALPGNVTAMIGQVSNGTITVTLSGLGSETDYSAALKAITFSNNSDTPDTTQRVMQVAFSNDTLTSAVAISRIDVVPVNDAPIAVPDSATTPEDTAITIAVLANDSDPEGNALSVTAAGALHGGVVRNADGTLTYTPNGDYNGPDTISYTIADGMGGTATSRVDVTVTPVNDVPVATGTLPDRSASDAQAVSYDTAGGFADLDGDALTYAAGGLPAGLTIDAATGRITGTIDRSASQSNGGSYTVVVTARDPGNATATQSFVVTVTNPAPTAVNDSAATAEDTPVTIAVLTNDSDPDGDPLTVLAASALHGVVARNADGTLTYTPNANYNGADTISYRISDGQGGTSDATVAITVAPQRDAPVNTVPPAQTVAEDGTLVFSGANGNALAITNVDGGRQTVMVAVTHGVFTLSGTGGLTFAVGDGTGDATMTFSGTVTAINAALQGSSFRGDADFNGAASLRLTTTIVPIEGVDFQNPDAEQPVVATTRSSKMNQDLVPGWRTTATDQQIEIWPDGFQGQSAYSGRQFFEINANQAASMYQEFRSTVGSPITVDYAHRGRAGTDVMRFTATDLGADRVFGTADDTVLFQREVSDGNAVWGAYTDTITSNATGNIIRLDFASVSTASGDPSIGNFLDAVNVTQAGAPSSDTDTVAITVTPVTDIAADSATTPEDVAITLDPLANDSFSDPSRSIVAIDGMAIVAGGAAVTVTNGTVQLDTNQKLIFTPGADYNGTTSFTYTVSAGGATETATQAVIVTPVNDAPRPLTIAPSYPGTDASSINRSIVNAFADPDGDTLTYTASGLPAGLTLDTATGIISGTLDRSASQVNGGNYTVTLTATDPSNAAATQTITIVVTNPAPTAVDDSATTAEDTPVTIAVLTNDSDPDGDPLTVTAATALHGAVVCNADGTLTYTPDADYNGTDTISYTISDGEGGTASATVAVIVTPTNDAPVATGTLPDRSTADGATVSYAAANAFADIDGDTLSYTATGLPTGLSIDATTGIISGTVDRSASQAGGGRYVVIITARDPSNTTATQQFAIDVANPAPTAVDDSAATHADTPVTIVVLGNDTDPDGDPLSVTSAGAQRGSVTILADGSLRYTPPAGFVGRDTISYTISDGQGGTSAATVTVDVANAAPTATALPPVGARDGQAVSLPVGAQFTDPDGDALRFTATGLPAGLTIDPITGAISGTIDRSASRINGGSYATTVTATDPYGATTSQTFNWTIADPAPTATNDSATTAEDTPVTIAVLTNDSDPDGDPLTVTAAAALHGAVVRNADGTLTYTPDVDYNGTDTISYTISDGEGGTAAATVAVTVTAVNDAPVATGLPPRATPDAATVSVPTAPAFSDVDGDTLRYAASGLPSGLSIDPTTGVISGTIAIGSVYGGPAGDGIYHAVVTATDPAGAVIATPFDWTVQQVAPMAINDSVTTPEETTVAIPVLANDSDGDGDALTIVAADATHGTVAITGGQLLFTPDADFNGDAVLTYTITDLSGNRSSATVTVTVTPINDAPVASPIPAATAQDAAAISLPVGGFFGDVDGDPLRYAATGLPAGVTIDPATGTITGTIDRGASRPGGGVYHVVVTATDPAGAQASSAFDWTIVNPAPTARNDASSTAEDTSATIAVLGNDSDPDGDPLTVTNAGAGHGVVTINPDGTLGYTPDRDFSGTDAIVYTIDDGNGGRATASVLVIVTAVNDAPVAAPDRATTAEDAPVAIAVLGNDTDVDGDPLTVTAATAANGTVTINADGTIAYRPAPDFNGTDTITYQISDARGGAATASATVTVTPVNDAPIARVDIVRIAEDTRVIVPVLANDGDIDSDPLTVTSATAQHGSVAVNRDGTLTYTPDADYNGADTIAYAIADGRGGTSSATVMVTVDAVNDAPVAVATAPQQAASDGAPVSIAAAPWFRDVDGDRLAYTATGLPTGLTIDPITGVIGGTPGRRASQLGGGLYTVAVTARDANGAAATATFTLTVTNPAPIANADIARTNEDTAVTMPVLGNDRDVDGDPLTVTAATAANGSVTINPDGTLAYTPGPNFAGTDTIRYTVSDGDGGTATAIVSVTVDPVNDAPIVPDRDPVEAVGGRPQRFDVLSGATDPDGDRLIIVGATAANGVVGIDPDGTLTFTPALGFVGTTSITYTLSDRQGGLTTAQLILRVADGRGADIEQLLRIGRVSFRDPSPALASLIVTDGEIRNPLSLLDIAENIRSLNTTQIGSRPVGDAVDAIRTLRGTAIDPDQPIAVEVARLDALRDQRDAGDRLFDHRWNDFDVKGLTGFSAAADRNACIMVESVVRGGAIYLEVRDTADAGARAPIRSVDVRLANGHRAPDWIKVDPRGLAIIERGADMDELHLIVRVTRTDGRTSATPIVIQGSTGEIELDRHAARRGHAPPLDHMLATPTAAAVADAARLARHFK